MSKIFISYRRDDSFGYAQTIYSKLIRHFSKDQVFMDVDTVELGVDFVRVIEQAVSECDVLLALIGRRWANVRKGAKSRLDDPNDFVRLEISTALARDIRVIPVLVDAMRMPSEKILPTSLKPLTRRNAMEISHTRFNYDVEQLIIAVRKILDPTEAKQKADELVRRPGVARGARRRPKSLGLKITKPESGETVSGRDFSVEGRFVKRPPSGKFRVFITNFDGTRIWPQKEVEFHPKSHMWKAKATLLEDPPDRAYILIAKIGKTGKLICDQYWKAGEERDVWIPISSLTPDTEVCDRVLVRNGWRNG